MNWDIYLNFLIAMFAIVNPIGIVPMWSELTQDRDHKVRKRVAFLLVSTAIIILTVFLISGKYLLQFFSIDLQVFKIAGGILLLLAGLSMVSGSATKLDKKDESDDDDLDTIVKKRYKKIMVPMVIPRLAGPGSITTVILYGSKADSFLDHILMAGLVLFTMTILFAIFSNSHLIEDRVDSIVLTIFTRLFGVIVAAIAMQFMLEGLGEVFPNWLEGASELEKGQSDTNSK